MRNKYPVSVGPAWESTVGQQQWPAVAAVAEPVVTVLYSVLHDMVIIDMACMRLVPRIVLLSHMTGMISRTQPAATLAMITMQ